MEIANFNSVGIISTEQVISITRQRPINVNCVNCVQ